MPFTHARPLSQLTVVASVIVCAAAALPASAGPRAPISYASSESAPAKPAIADKATQRIAFRYPGTSGTLAPAEKSPVRVAKPVEAAMQTTWTAAPVARTTDAALSLAGSGPKMLVQTAALEPLVSPATLPEASIVSEVPAQAGLAIVYGDEFSGLPTSNGEIFDQNALTAAHPTLPLPSLVRVRNPATGREVTVRVNDRGPFEEDAVLQVSRKVALELGFDGAGKAELTFRVLDPAPGAAGKPVSAPKPMLRAAVMPAPAEAELLGGDELAGGPDVKPARAAVAWPEPPADWGVRPQPVKISAAVSGTHYVQLASFADRANAEAMYIGLKADLPVEIVPAHVNGADYFRVRVGPLSSRASAQDLRDQLDAEGKGDGRVVDAD